ncbi:MAG: hypothetical protein Kow0069_38180 [Promethearchaeota archaeon]
MKFETFEEFPANWRNEVYLSVDPEPPVIPKRRVVLRTNERYGEVVAQAKLDVVKFPPGEIEEGRLVTLDLEKCPVTLEWDPGRTELRDVAPGRDAWHATLAGDLQFDTDLWFVTFQPGDFPAYELVGAIGRLQREFHERVVDRLAGVLNASPGDPNALDDFTTFLREYKERTKFLQRLDSLVTDYLDHFLHYLTCRRFVKPDAEFEDLEGLSPEQLVEMLNETLPSSQRRLLFDRIVEQEGFNHRLNAERLARAEELLSRMQTERRLGERVKATFFDRENLYAKARRDKVIFQCTERDAEVDVTDAVEQTLTFSVDLYGPRHHFVGNVKAERRVLVVRREANGEVHSFHVKGDKRLKHQIMDAGGRLRKYGNWLVLRAETLHAWAYEARKFKSLAFLNPDALLRELERRGVPTASLEDMAERAKADHREGHVLYSLAVQAFTGLEPEVLEQLLKAYDG